MRLMTIMMVLMKLTVMSSRNETTKEFYNRRV